MNTPPRRDNNLNNIPAPGAPARLNRLNRLNMINGGNYLFNAYVNYQRNANQNYVDEVVEQVNRRLNFQNYDDNNNNNQNVR